MKCDFCKKRFPEKEMDLVKVDGGESVWLCRSCEGDLDKLRMEREE